MSTQLAIHRPQVDLNALRGTMLNNQNSANPEPKAPAQQVLVSKEGEIVLGKDGKRPEHKGKTFATVPQHTFAWGLFGRCVEEKRIALNQMPSNTRQHKATTAEGEKVNGWLYDITCPRGIEYRFFLYFDGQAYQVICVSPVIEQRFKNAHDGHIFPTGKLCLGWDHGSGRPDMVGAYAKSVTWAAGMTLMVQLGIPFPFSSNN